MITLPPDLYGKHDRDPLLRMLERLMNAHMNSLRFFHRDEVVGTEVDRTLEMTVTGRKVEAFDENVVGLTLAAANGSELPRWRAGAHIDVELPSGRIRQYSLCGDPADADRYRIAVRRIPNGGGGSIEIHDTLSVGSRLRIRGPRNAFAFAVPGYGSTADHLHFVAGGIGITPILPMMRLAHRLGLSWSMVYTGRTLESLPFLSELPEFGARVQVRTDDVYGLPDAAMLLDGSTPESAIYACGPSPMIETLQNAVSDLPDAEFHHERFSAPPVVGGVRFEVELARTGQIVDVAADQTILQAIGDVRPDITYSCRQGFCGTCRVPVVGRAEGMLICTERTGGERVVLDL